MKNPVYTTDGLDFKTESESRFLNTVKVVGMLGCVIHVALLILMASINTPLPLFGFQFFTILFWVLISSFLWFGYVQVPIASFFLFTIGHIFITTLYFGSGAGFIHYFWVGLPFIFFNQKIRSTALTIYILSGLMLCLFVMAVSEYYDPAPSHPEIVLYLNIFNLIIAFLIIVWMCYHFRSTQVKLEGIAYKLARLDPLTELLNRRGITDEIELDYLQTFRTRLASIIIIDIDHFKQINDIYGHFYGDEVLRRISVILKQTLNSSYIISRWGGDEFLIICPETEENEAVSVADNLREVLSKSVVRYKETAIKIKVTCGVAQIQTDKSILETIKRADNALIEGKQSGRNTIVVAEWRD